MTKCFLIVGMHRSATSLVAKGLHDAGVHMGDRLMGAGNGNRAGHFEDLDAVEINQDILAAAGGSWSNPPAHEAICGLADQFADRVSGLVARRSGLWGMKDPRLSLTWPVWLPHLTGDVHVVWIRRDPAAVAASLKRRDAMREKDGRMLAETYIRRIRLLQQHLDERSR